MSKLPVTRRYAEFAAALHFSRLAPDIVDKAKLCIADAVAHALASTTAPHAVAARGSVTRSDPDGAATIWGTGHRASPESAAYANAVASACTSQSDTYVATASHPGMCVVPVVLALGEEIGATGRNLLTALVAGYETMARVGHALVTPNFAAVFRPTGHTGPVGAATAAARLVGLKPEQAGAAIALAANTMGGFNAWAAAGTRDLLFHGGTLARNAIQAVRLAEAGVVAAPAVFEGPGGILAAFGRGAEAQALTADLGSRFDIRDVVFKPAPTCIFSQGPCSLAARLAAEHGPVRPEEIESVETRVSQAAAQYPGCDFTGPFSSQSSARISIQFCTVAILAAGGIKEQTWDGWRDPTMTAAAGRARVIVDDALTAAYPGRNGSRTGVRLRDGREIEAAIDDFTSMTGAEIEARFMDYARRALGEARARAAWAAIGALDRKDAEVRDLGRALRA